MSTETFLSSEWFAQKAQESAYIAFGNTVQEQLSWFVSIYGLDQLKALSGKKLLDTMFYNDTDNKENLCYTLEMNPSIKENFGSIAGGSSFKFGLFFHRQKKTWMAGSPQKPKELTQDAAIQLGTEIRDNLVAGAEEISRFPEPQTKAEYEEIKKQVEKHIRLDSIWILKYYKMIFPSYFQSVYSEEQQLHMLYALQIQPGDSQFVRMGQLALFSKSCGISPETVSRIFADHVGWYKPIYRIGTGQDGACFQEWRAQGFCALGFNEIEGFTEYLDEKGKADKEKIASALLEQNESYNKATASRKANEIVDFIDAANNETLVVAMNGQQMLGIGLLVGDVYYEPSLDPLSNCRKVEWRYIPEQPIIMPVFEGRLTSFVSLSDEKNLMLIYRLLYRGGEGISLSDESWWPDITEYDPGITTSRWLDLLRREDVLTQDWGGLLAAFYLHGPATCKEIGIIYNKTPPAVSGFSSTLAKKVQSITQCPIGVRDNGQNRYWPILFQGKDASKEQQGNFMWKLRQELYDALTTIGIEKYEWKEEKSGKATWLLMWNPNAWVWNDLNRWIEEVNNGIRKPMTWTCLNTHVQVGDHVYLAVYGKGIRRGIVASGIVTKPPFLKPHWDEQKRDEGKQTKAIEVEFDKLVDYRSENILPIELLQRAFPNQAWSSQSSGIEIRSEYTEGLSNMWYSEQSPLIRFVTGFNSSFSRNRIIFGAPGTGKSYLLNQDKDELLSDGGSFERVTFHPDYSYAHFVGTYKPVPFLDENGHNAITYKYVPGPFMRTYVKALRNSRENTPQPYLIIIEEINRANVAAVFGDVFQLLDRDDDETSMYSIQASEDMKQYLSEELGGQPADYGEIKLPDNMFIWATMNSADQGVFPMDTAFKRRWDFTYLNINTGESGIAGKRVILGTGSYQREVDWNTLRRAINDRLSAFRLNEDKLLGPYFLSRKIIPAEGEIDLERFVDAFKNKVLMYLFDDAAKQKRASLFADGIDTTKYSSICETFDEKGVFVFCTEISSQFQIDESPNGGVL